MGIREPHIVTLIANETSYSPDGNIARRLEYEYDGAGEEAVSKNIHYKEESGVWYQRLR